MLVDINTLANLPFLEDLSLTWTTTPTLSKIKSLSTLIFEISLKNSERELLIGNVKKKNNYKFI